MDEWLDPAGVSTQRLYVRVTTRDDLPALERTWLDPDIRRYLRGPIAPETLERARTERDDLEPSCGFLPELWGHGYAREAWAAVLDWGFTNVPGTERIVAISQAANLRSVRLLQAAERPQQARQNAHSNCGRTPIQAG